MPTLPKLPFLFHPRLPTSDCELTVYLNCVIRPVLVS
jgi:hypothetical protein